MDVEFGFGKVDAISKFHFKKKGGAGGPAAARKKHPVGHPGGTTGRNWRIYWVFSTGYGYLVNERREMWLVSGLFWILRGFERERMCLLNIVSTTSNVLVHYQ